MFRTLAELIVEGPIAEEDVRRIGLQSAEAIEAAQERGIVHRDLKPANIKFTEDGKVKVLDFGLAKAVDEVHPSPARDATQVGTILGTPAYMFPEQAVGSRADRRSDIWSFGVVLMEMLTGKRPFEGASVDDIRSAIVRKEPDWPGVPVHWAPLLRRCLTKDVRRRLQSIGEARLLLEEGPAAPPLSARRPVWTLAACT
jgi:serine/threonine-protein kinase